MIGEPLEENIATSSHCETNEVVFVWQIVGRLGVRRDSGKVYRNAKCREDLGLLNPNKDTFDFYPELLPIFDDLNYQQG